MIKTMKEKNNLINDLKNKIISYFNILLKSENEYILSVNKIKKFLIFLNYINKYINQNNNLKLPQTIKLIIKKYNNDFFNIIIRKIDGKYLLLRNNKILINNLKNINNENIFKNINNSNQKNIIDLIIFLHKKKNLENKIHIITESKIILDYIDELKYGKNILIVNNEKNEKIIKNKNKKFNNIIYNYIKKFNCSIIYNYLNSRVINIIKGYEKYLINKINKYLYLL